MAVDLNHTIVPSRDKQASAEFLAGILGLKAGPQWGPFVPVETANGVTLDYMDSTEFRPIHYCFIVSEPEFDEIFGRIKERGLRYFADPGHRKEGEINHLYGGRGVYFDDPDGHNMEVITAPYA
ncbi:VOC family protein [Nonomuraea africana]|uniref:Catechol 2,3-dioxygenase-like lactoylglutathione lyase family enzyme n=1 Tax=Nonomuraea africana TaxID=46171 RepID=A0ABR9KJX6_9ACTN|nr:VOC family protein [Nonomuraea africana]MBE1562328.1 catechol 2,3-dioxygenase-like lactoylglutathione lyase family enzyme [Nonomuraea africana]